MSPAIVRARPARRVECGPDLDGNDGLPWVARRLRDHHTPSTHPIIFDPPGGSPRLTMGRNGPRVTPGATHVRPACRGSPEGFWWSMKARAHPAQRMTHKTVPHANDHQITTFNVRCPHDGNEPRVPSLDYDCAGAARRRIRFPDPPGGSNVGCPGRQPGVRGRPPSSRRDPQGGSNVVQISMATTNYLRWPGASRPPYPIHAPDHIRPALRVASTHDGAGRTPGFTRGYPCSTRVPRVAGRIPVGRRNPAVAGERHSPLDSPPRERSFNNDVRRPHDGNEPRAAITITIHDYELRVRWDRFTL